MRENIFFFLHLLTSPFLIFMCIRSVKKSSNYLKDLENNNDVSEDNRKYKEFTQKYNDHADKEKFGTKIIMAYMVGFIFVLLFVIWGNFLFLNGITQSVALFFTEIFTFQMLPVDKQSLLTLNSLRAFSFNFLQFYLVISLLNAPIVIFLVVYLIFFFNQEKIMEMIIPSLTNEISFSGFVVEYIIYLILSIVLSFLIIFVFTINSRDPATYLSENCLRLAKEHFDPIIIIEDKSLNFANGLYFTKNFLIIMGDIHLLTEEEIFACILHEIGHGGPKILMFYFLLNYIIFFLTIISCYYLIDCYVNVLFGEGFGALKITLLIVNIPVINILTNIFKNLLNFNGEYAADTFVKKSNYTESLVNALLKLHYSGHMPNKIEYFANVLISSHSSNFYRIKNLYPNDNNEQ